MILKSYILELFERLTVSTEINYNNNNKIWLYLLQGFQKI
jgi:hypothetical protein